MAEKELKYSTYLDQIPNCPPDGASSKELEAYRFVFEKIDHPHNFLPNLIRKPARVQTIDDVKKCTGYALSFYTEGGKAEENYKRLNLHFRNFSKFAGDHLAVGQIVRDHGLCTEPDEDSHFDIHEYKGSDFLTSFKIQKKLI